MNQQYDSIVIGTGQSGPFLADRLVRSGRKTAIIERKKFGGTCVNTGCIPTKTLIASARVAHMARRASEFGVMLGGAVQVDMAQVKARKDQIVRQSSDGVADWLKGMHNLDVIEGHASFEAPNVIKVNGDLLEAKEIFINVGGRAFVPKIAGLDQVKFLTNSSMLEVDYLPKHLMIIGGSYIGLEFAQMYRRFGSEVTVIENGSRLIGREDEQVSATVREILEGEGIQFKLAAKTQQVKKQGSDIALTLESNGTSYEISGSHLLIAVGRVPNTYDLGLDKAGIKTDDRGYILVDDRLCTNASGVWALGDCNGRGAFTHTSYNDFEIVAANLLNNGSRSVTDRIPAYALFIDPPLGRIGMTEREVRASGRKALIATMMMSRVGRARERSETDGHISILVDAETKKILGATFLGIEGDEIVHSVLDVMYAGAPYTTIQNAMHIHPTVSEFIPTLLGNLRPL